MMEKKQVCAKRQAPAEASSGKQQSKLALPSSRLAVCLPNISTLLNEQCTRVVNRVISNDPSAGSPTETLLRLLLPLNDQVCASFQNYLKETQQKVSIPGTH